MWNNILILQPHFFLQVWTSLVYREGTLLGIIMPNEPLSISLERAIYHKVTYAGPSEYRQGVKYVPEITEQIGKALEELLANQPPLIAKKAFIAGQPEWVLAAEEAAHAQGCSLQRLYVLPFSREELDSYLSDLQGTKRGETLDAIVYKKLITWR